jgi:hypothetical protein
MFSAVQSPITDVLEGRDGLGSSMDMIAVNLITSQKKPVESGIAQTTPANGALNPECRETLPCALDASFETLKNPRHKAGGFFEARGYIRPHATAILYCHVTRCGQRMPLYPRTHLRRKIISAASSGVGTMSDCKRGGLSSIELHGASSSPLDEGLQFGGLSPLDDSHF